MYDLSQRAGAILSASKFIWPLWRAARARTSVILTLGLLEEAEGVKVEEVNVEGVEVEGVKVGGVRVGEESLKISALLSLVNPTFLTRLVGVVSASSSGS